MGEPSPIKNRAYVDELEARAARLGIADRVIFTGLRSDVPALLSAVDVSVMPSLNEALSNVLLESMAAGAAVVATDVGGTSEALVNGKNGLLIPPADPQAMAAAILQLIDNAPLGARARQPGQTHDQRSVLAGSHGGGHRDRCTTTCYRASNGGAA